MTKKIFSYEESPYHPGYFVIRPNQDLFHLDSTEGSFSIICARLMNLSYADYLRFCRDILGATIIGKNSKYPVAYFKEGENLRQFVKLLNGRANVVLFEREHPDYEEHKKFVEDYESKLREGRNVHNS